MSTPEPRLPEAVDAGASLLSRKFGRETVNYFAGSSINRLSWLRGEHGFLRAAFASPDARFLALRNLSPLAKSKTDLAFLARDDVVPLTGQDPFELAEDELIKQFDSAKPKPLLVFLGVSEDPAAQFEFRGFRGSPYFAIDVTPKESYADAATALAEGQEGQGLTFMENTRFMTLNAIDAGVYAQARAIIDWNNRNPFCGGCGLPTLAVHAGYKRTCPPADFAGASSSVARADCPTRKGVSNLSFPRTDPTMIVAVISADGQRVLLGRQSRYPPGWYSTLAGFIEPGESIEESVRREAFEEAGVRVGRVVLHSSQPWPYPANLMIGAIAQALPDGETVDLGNDPELESARWFSMDELREALRVGVGFPGGTNPVHTEYKEGGLRLPPHTAIANRLLNAVAEGYATVLPKI